MTVAPGENASIQLSTQSVRYPGLASPKILPRRASTNLLFILRAANSLIFDSTRVPLS